MNIVKRVMDTVRKDMDYVSEDSMAIYRDSDMEKAIYLAMGYSVEALSSKTEKTK